jgi:hypothetical protein
VTVLNPNICDHHTAAAAAAAIEQPPAAMCAYTLTDKRTHVLLANTIHKIRTYRNSVTQLSAAPYACVVRSFFGSTSDTIAVQLLPKRKALHA